MSEAPITRVGRALALLHRGGTALLDLVYPPRCPGCGSIGAVLCASCQARIEPPPTPACIRCGHPASTESLCPTCRATPSHLDRIAASAVFAPPLREAIHELKYNNGRSLARPLGAAMVAYWQEQGFSADIIVPVPLHRARLAERGYNQAALLARVLGEATHIPLDEKAVVRHKATQQQALLNAAERRENVKEAFTCSGDVTGKRVVLVDDVATTGATLEACAAALRAGGASAVWAFTLARARWDPKESGTTDSARS